MFLPMGEKKYISEKAFPPPFPSASLPLFSFTTITIDLYKYITYVTKDIIKICVPIDSVHSFSYTLCGKENKCSLDYFILNIACTKE